MNAQAEPTTSQPVIRLDRLRLGEWIMFVASVALLVDLEVFPWYTERKIFQPGLSQLGHTGFNFGAGTAYPILSAVAIICVLLTWALCAAQVAKPGPAVPLAMTVFVTILDVVMLIWLLIRVVFVQYSITDLGTGTSQIKPDVASVASLFFAALMLYGAWRALRTDGLAAADNPRHIETLRLAPRAR